LFESDAGLTAAYSGKGWIYVKQEQWELACPPDPMEAPEQEPSPAEAYCNLGFSHFKKAQWDRAIADLDKAISQDPALDRGKWDRDWAIGKRTQWDPVIEEYETALEIVSGYSEIDNQAAPATGSEECDTAIACYNKTIELSQEPAISKIAEEAILFINQWLEKTQAVSNSCRCTTG
jgi:tetratricopeptide (TPR) repeat protein